MRTTIDIPPGLHQRIRASADERQQSFSAVVTEALIRGMMPIDSTSTLRRSPVTGLRGFSSGYPITTEEVATLIDEDL